MSESQFESVEQLAEATASHLAQAAAGAGFDLFRDKKFRQLACFDKIGQLEQDRIFNELVLAYLILIMLMLEAPDLRLPDEFREYCRDLNKMIPKAYLDYLRETGIEEEHIRDWTKLIQMRYDEYAKDRHSARAAAMEIASAEKELDLKELSKIQMTLPVQTVAIGSLHHICRGETDGHNELFKVILKALGRFYVEMRIHFECGKITPLMRALVAVRRWYRKVFLRKG